MERQKKQHRKLCVINQTCDKHKKELYIYIYLANNARNLGTVMENSCWYRDNSIILLIHSHSVLFFL